MTEPVSLFRRALGDDFDRLPSEVRRMHEISTAASAKGISEVSRGSSLMARIIGWVARLPAAGSDVPVTVLFAARDGGELWHRTFGSSRFQTVLTMPAGLPGHLFERFGPLRFLLRVSADDRGLSLVICGMTLFGLPMPRLLWPVTEAREQVEEGLFAFDVLLSAPVAGLIIRYRGRLNPPEPLADQSDHRV